MNINKIISNLINDKASVEELETLEQWKSESEENFKELSARIKLQKTSSELEGYKQYNVSDAWDKVESEITSDSELHPELQQSLNLKRYLIVFMTLIIVSSFLFILYKNNSKPEEINFYQTDFAGLHIDLKDGSTVELDHSSVLKLGDDFVKNRVLELEGRAFFTVNHISEEDPFTIQIPNAEIEVIGTEFSVYSKGGKAEIAVLSGIVEVTSENRKVRLTKGDRLLFQDNDFLKLSNAENNYFSWNTGTLVYDDSTLKEVIEDLIWTFNVKIDTSEIKFPTGCRIATKYQNMELEKILEELNSLFGLEYKYKDEVIFVKNINCS